MEHATQYGTQQLLNWKVIRAPDRDETQASRCRCLCLSSRRTHTAREDRVFEVNCLQGDETLIKTRGGDVSSDSNSSDDASRCMHRLKPVEGTEWPDQHDA